MELGAWSFSGVWCLVFGVSVVGSVLLTGLLTTGCASPHPSAPHHLAHTAHLFPAEALVTQRGVLTVHGRQVSLNGYVSKSQTRGLRFVLTESFGGVLADVLVTSAGKVQVLQLKRPFRPAWVERYVAVDLKCIFADATETDCPVQVLSPTHFRVQRRWYKLDLWTVETKVGPQPAEMFEPRQAIKR